MSELKPCPFCGEIPYESKKSGCVGCDSACWFSGTAMNPNDWNERPIEDALQARIAKLEAERGHYRKALEYIARYELSDDYEVASQAGGWLKRYAKEALKESER